jgi:hypothetical protein
VPRRRWEDNIKICVMESGLKGYGSDSSGLGYEELADFCVHGNDLVCCMKYREFNYHLVIIRIIRVSLFRGFLLLLPLRHD